MNSEAYRRLRSGLMVLSAALLCACVTEQGGDGITDDTIRVGMILDLTGPLAVLGQVHRSGQVGVVDHGKPLVEFPGCHELPIQVVHLSHGRDPPQFGDAVMALGQP